MAGLLRQLGHGLTARDVAGRLEALAKDTNGTVLVAVGTAPVIGLVALQWYGTLQDHRRVARITALVVDEAERGHGIGRSLVKSAAQAARVAGCDRLEIAARTENAAAQAFYRSIGFGAPDLGFTRSLRKKPSGA
jgi:aminoglycoside 6'-N-acetyltransferase I